MIDATGFARDFEAAYTALDPFVMGRELEFIRALLTDLRRDVVDCLKEGAFNSPGRWKKVKIAIDRLLQAELVAWNMPYLSASIDVEIFNITSNVPVGLSSKSRRDVSIGRVSHWLSVQLEVRHLISPSSHMVIIRRPVSSAREHLSKSPRACFLWALAAYMDVPDSAVKSLVTTMEEEAESKINRFIEEHT